jgi:O-antigen ligase
MPDLGLPLALVALAIPLGVLAGVQPALAVGAAVGLVFVVLLTANLTAGLCVFAIVSFIDVLPGNPAISFTKAVGLVLALSWLATISTRNDARAGFFSAHPVAVCLLALFLVWASASTLWAEDPSAAATAASRFGLNFLLFPIVYTAVSKPRHAFWLATTFVAGALLSAAYGLFVVPTSNDVERLTGAIGEANELASVLVAALVLAGGLALAARHSPSLRLAALVAGALCLVGVVLTLSRAGVLALGVVFLMSIFIMRRSRGRSAIVALVAAVAAVGYFGAFSKPEVRERVTTFHGGSGRVDLWKVGWRMFEARPLTGVGAGNFQISSPHYLLKPGVIARDDFVLDKPKQTHNIYLQALSELGIPGLLLFVGIITFSLSCGARAARAFRRAGDRRLEILTWAFLVAAVGVLVTDFFQSEQFSKQLWLLLALGPTLLALSRQAAVSAVPDRARSAASLWRTVAVRR